MAAPRCGESNAVSKKLSLLALVALALAWWLFSPHSGDRHRRTAMRSATPTVAPTQTPVAQAPSQEPAPSNVPLPARPSAAPSSLAAAQPQPSASPAPTLPEPRGTTTAAPSGMPKVALIVDDCGQWLATERGFVALDVPVTLSVLPDVAYTGTIAREAAGAGKGVMLHLPMDTVSGLNPGPGKVTTGMSDAQIADQVADDLSQVPYVSGVNNHEGSKGSADPRVMRDVIGVLAKRGDLFFIDSRTSAASVGERTAQSQGVPAGARDVFLDNQASVAYTQAQLREAASIARRTGSAIAIGHPRPTTLTAVREMIPELQAAGIQFVLVSDLVSKN